MLSTTLKRQDKNKGALSNVDNEGLSAYKRQRQIFRNMNTFEEKIQKLEETVYEIKELLDTVIENGKKQCQYQ